MKKETQIPKTKRKESTQQEDTAGMERHENSWGWNT